MSDFKHRPSAPAPARAPAPSSPSPAPSASASSTAGFGTDADLPADGHLRVLIESVTPSLDDGRYPVKRVRGDEVVVEADLVADGHDVLGGWLLFRRQGDDASSWRHVVLEPLVNDRYRASFVAEELGVYELTIVGWVDGFATWCRGLAKKIEAQQDVAVDLLVGLAHVRAAAARATGADKKLLVRSATALAHEATPMIDRAKGILGYEVRACAARHPDLEHATRYDRTLRVVVDRPRARFSAWYELFPRSCGPVDAAGVQRHGTFKDAESRLPYVASLGFDVLYLPPVHPIGTAHRKGKNNSLTPDSDDVGSPWAVGAADGGHLAVHADLGTLDDLRRFVRRAAEYGLEVALDIAFQASPDHPWVKEHPEWFVARPDGTIQYAENPPKKYQDIYPLDFESKDWRGLWLELRGVFEFWVEQGVRIFRVDNPHTKSLRFWGWCIESLKAQYPDLIFLAEAFTRPKLMYALAKLGYTQSYTYFTWRHTKAEFTEYLTELTQTEVAEFYRPNFWPNTPDILPPHLTHGGRPAFMARLVLASTLSSNYGIYGPAFELMERTPRPGVEEYIDNEKYQLRDWDLERPDSLRHLIGRLNRIRRAHRALQSNASLTFHPTDNDHLLCYSKQGPDEAIVVVVNLDPHHTHAGFVELDLALLGVDGPSYVAHDLVSDARYSWIGPRNFVSLDPHVFPAHVFRVR
jgi:starch synthase (maltosyl-transferring)